MEHDLEDKTERTMELFTNGLVRENPVLKMVLGTCPALAVTTSAQNGLGMGIAATFVLLCSNTVISSLRHTIPQEVRIPSYITIIAGFVSIVQMIVKAYFHSLDQALGVFLPLIVVNCIILGRAEGFASKNPVYYAAVDGLGMGLGFTISLTLLGAIREIFGAGTLFGYQVLPSFIQPFTIMTSAPGGFFVFGLLMAVVSYWTSRKKEEPELEGAQDE